MKKNIGQGAQVVAHSPLSESMVTLYLQRIIIGETINNEFFSCSNISIFFLTLRLRMSHEDGSYSPYIVKLLTLNWVVVGGAVDFF